MVEAEKKKVKLPSVSYAHLHVEQIKEMIEKQEWAKLLRTCGTSKCLLPLASTFSNNNQQIFF